MVDFKLWLWPEWYQECNKSKTLYSKRYPITIYGSVFDRFFWEIAIDILIYLMDKFPTYKLQLIILPISRKTTVNQKIKTEIHQILAEEPISKELLHKINHLVVKYWEEIVNLTQKFQEENIKLGLDRQSPEEQNHYKNLYLFGPLTTRFLENFSPLPLFEIIGYRFHGVPLGLSITNLLDTYLTSFYCDIC